jgi:hypothetical protein
MRREDIDHLVAGVCHAHVGIGRSGAAHQPAVLVDLDRGGLEATDRLSLDQQRERMDVVENRDERRRRVPSSVVEPIQILQRPRGWGLRLPQAHAVGVLEIRFALPFAAELIDRDSAREQQPSGADVGVDVVLDGAEIAAAEQDLPNVAAKRLTGAALIRDLHRASERRERSGDDDADLSRPSGDLLQVELDGAHLLRRVAVVRRPLVDLGAHAVEAARELREVCKRRLRRGRRLTEIDADVVAPHDVQRLGDRAAAPLGVAAGRDHTEDLQLWAHCGDHQRDHIVVVGVAVGI